jgi:hypothetical protein
VGGLNNHGYYLALRTHGEDTADCEMQLVMVRANLITTKFTSNENLGGRSNNTIS